MSLFQASMQEGRFYSKLLGGVAGVDQRTTNRSPRRNGGREARRGREDQRHHVQGGSAVATRSCSWSYAVHGDKQCVLRPTYGFRGVRVGEASHPGPVQTRNARRLQSTQVDSEIGHRSTQIDPEDDPPVRSGRFAPLSSDSDDSPNVHVCRAPTNAIDCGWLQCCRVELIHQLRRGFG